MKLELVKKQIKLNFLISATIAFITALVIYFGFFFYSDDNTGTQKVDQQIEEIKSKNDALLSDIENGRKFTKIFGSIPKRQKYLSGINTSLASENFEKLGEQFFIKDRKIVFLDTTVFKDEVDNTKNLIPYYSEITLDFRAFSDDLAVQFLENFISELDGYWTITEFSLNKTGNYSDEELIKISKNTAKPVLIAHAQIKWFNLSSQKKSDEIEQNSSSEATKNSKEKDTSN
jgi:hypothetical protein